MKPNTKPIYLDHNASTPLLPAVFEAMRPWLTSRYGNPSSTHFYGRCMREGVEQAREQVAALIDCEPAEVFFTSGGTEANNLAIRGVAAANPDRRHVITSVIEHPATSEPCNYLAGRGFGIDRVQVDETGRVKIDQVENLLSGSTLLVSIIHANSETGTIQPLREITELAQGEHGALVHTDAAQSLGKIDVSVQREQVDLLSIAGHKLYAPQGVGALYIRHGTPIKPILFGAGHEAGMRPGTENVASIVGLGMACAMAREDLASQGRQLRGLRDRLWNRLSAQVAGLALNGHRVDRLPNTLNVRFPGVSGSALLSACPGIAASTGSACHETGESASATILAMGVPEDEAIGSVRLTLGRGNTPEEVDLAADELASAWRRIAARSR
jgi:cysteine desulfurase